jgi:hypothetical protein
VPLDDAGAKRKRELEEILALRRSFGTLGRRLSADKRPIRLGLADLEQVSKTDSEPTEDPDSNQISTTVRRLEPGADVFRIPDPPAPEPAPAHERRLPWLWLTAIAAALTIGLVVGLAVGNDVPQPAPRPAPPVSSQAAATTPSVTTSAEARPPASVPSSCLATAERGDIVIDMLVKNRRGEPLGRALKAYTQASQSCRKEASIR